MKKTILHGLAALSLTTAVAGYAWAQEAAQPAAPAAEAQPAAPAQTESAPAAEPHAAAPEGSGGEAAGGHDGEIHLAGEGETQHYPLLAPREQDWSFAGPFGTYDKGQLQRGLKVYKEVCSACHSMNLVSFRTLEHLGYSEAQVKALAAEYTIPKMGDDGEMADQPGLPSDYFPSPFANAAAAAAANGGAAPPDFSLIAKARGVTRGFPQFVIDIFTGYQESGPDYIYSLLTGYGHTPPAGMVVAEGTHYNPYFLNGQSLAMAAPLSDGQVTYDDGAPATVDQYARDVSAFLMWTAEPHLEDRKKIGFRVILFMLIFGAMVYLVKRKVWANEAH
jgi:ubiquinol-cytochrome c reductase cytochrome c1 subunit